MRVSTAIVVLFSVWIAAHSHFNPAYFWRSVERNFHATVAELDAALKVRHGPDVTASLPRIRDLKQETAADALKPQLQAINDL